MESPELPLEYTCTACHCAFKGEPIGEQGIIEMSKSSYELSSLPKRNCYFILVCEDCADKMFQKIEFEESRDSKCH